MDVLLVEDFLHLMPEMGDCDEIGAAGVLERVVHSLGGFGVGQATIGKQPVKLVDRDLEDAGESRSYPGWGSVSPLRLIQN